MEPKHVDQVASLDYVHVYRFIIHIAKQLAKKQLSSILFFPYPLFQYKKVHAYNLTNSLLVFYIKQSSTVALPYNH